MIIPVKCFTCGKLLADKYLYYQSEVRKIKLAENVLFSKQKVVCFGKTEKYMLFHEQVKVVHQHDNKNT